MYTISTAAKSLIVLYETCFPTFHVLYLINMKQTRLCAIEKLYEKS